MDYKSITLDFIIEWCQANNQVDWLKATAEKKTPCKVYPRVKKDGKSVADKSQEPKEVMRPISFIQIKTEFVNTFMPEIAPKKKDAKPSMYDRIKAL